MAQRSLARFYNHFCARTDTLLLDFMTTPQSPCMTVGRTPATRLIAYSRGFLVNRLFHLWGEFCRSLVVASALGGYLTLGGHVVASAPNIRRRSDIPGAIRERAIVGPGTRWEDPRWTSTRVDRLQLANQQQVKLGIASAPYDDLRRVRHFVIHANRHTRANFDVIARRYALFGVAPHDLLLHRLPGGGTVLEGWVRDFQDAAFNATL